MKQKMKKYYIMLGGRYVGETSAVSSEKACNNYWWKNDKCCSPYTYTNRRPDDYEAIEKGGY